MFYLFLCCTCLLSKDYQYSPGTGSCKEDLLAKWSWLILSTSIYIILTYQKKKLQCVTIVPKWKKLNPRHKWHMIVKKVWNARKCGENHILMQSEDEMLLNCLYW